MPVRSRSYDSDSDEQALGELIATSLRRAEEVLMEDDSAGPDAIGRPLVPDSVRSIDLAVPTDVPTTEGTPVNSSSLPGDGVDLEGLVEES